MDLISAYTAMSVTELLVGESLWWNSHTTHWQLFFFIQGKENPDDKMCIRDRNVCSKQFQQTCPTSKTAD